MTAGRAPWFMTVGRALRGRCPHCGRGAILASWLRVNPRCAICGLRFERGHDEEQDYWLGAYTLNFLVTETIFGALLLAVLLVTWPHPPWTWILGGGATLMVLVPIAFYPLSKTLWLAIDLVARPAQPEDFAP